MINPSFVSSANTSSESSVRISYARYQERRRVAAIFPYLGTFEIYFIPCFAVSFKAEIFVIFERLYPNSKVPLQIE